MRCDQSYRVTALPRIIAHRPIREGRGAAIKTRTMGARRTSTPQGDMKALITRACRISIQPGGVKSLTTRAHHTSTRQDTAEPWTVLYPRETRRFDADRTKVQTRWYPMWALAAGLFIR